ncbi:GMC oxidoreductase [Actinomadura gamaensis]|uniref:Cholesterol oxidase n=1 Tax=Actinomadura gamaensis TaxID=1763541 RepID=A0ABV9UDA3_9ACTN
MRHRVVIIGSGIGGSVTAFRLARAGVDNVVLERGRRWPVLGRKAVFPSLTAPDRRLIWRDGEPSSLLATDRSAPVRLLRAAVAAALPRSTGLMEISPHRDLTIVCGAGVGGGTLTFGGMLPQPLAGPFRQVFPDSVDYEELDDVYYPRARRRLGAVPFPDDLFRHPQYRSHRLWRSALDRSGLPVERIPNGYDFDVVRAELAGTADASVTAGEYIFTGTNSGAKLSVDRTYLAWAERTGRTVVRPLHRVTDISQAGDGDYQVTVDRLGDDGAVAGRLVISCEKLILAAGGVHTPRMLTTARATGALPGLNEHVGADWGTNADQVLLLKARHAATGRRQAGPLSFLVRDHTRTAALTHMPLPWPVETGLLALAGMGISERLGRWRHRGGRARLEWSADNDAAARRRIRDLAGQAAGHVPGGATVVAPTALAPLTVHPLGGAVLGRATDAYGRLHGHQGLYCLDAALMPGSTAGVNPALTIAAVVERCLDHIIDDFVR